MRTAISLMTAVFLSAVAAYEKSESAIVNERPVSVLEVSTSSPIPEAQEILPETETGQIPTPLATETVPSIQEPIAPGSELILDNSFVPAPAPIQSHAYGSDVCYGCRCCSCRCCPPPTVPTTICLVDPCGCEYEVCVHVPVCCADHAPTVAWRRGLFGRQIASLCWDCCNKSVRVVVNRWGRVIVWG